jgi:ferritin-like metal-binding protein YciE
MPIIGSLRDLLVADLQILYQAEVRLHKALTKIAKASSRPLLKERFGAIRQQTEEHARRLERGLRLLDALPNLRECRAMAGLIEEAEEAIFQVGPNALRDANLTGTSQRIAHYKMAAYAGAEIYARKIGQPELAVLLALTQAETAEANRNLAAISVLVVEEAFLLSAKQGLPAPRK